MARLAKGSSKSRPLNRAAWLALALRDGYAAASKEAKRPGALEKARRAYAQLPARKKAMVVAAARGEHSGGKQRSKGKGRRY